MYANVAIYNVEQGQIISTLILTTLDNSQQRYFQRRVSQPRSTLKQCCEYNHLQKVEKSKKILLSSKNMKRNMKLNTLNSKFRLLF